MSTVRLGRNAKARLKRLQEAWEATAQDKPTQAELLDKGLAYLEQHQDAFLKEAVWRPLTRAEIAALKKRVVSDWGPGSGSDDIDEVVYGKT